MESKMKCVTLAKKLAPADLKKLKEDTKGPAKVLIEKYARASEQREAHSNKHRHPATQTGEVVRQNVGEKVATLGSDEAIYAIGDCGLFAAVVTAYNNHWKLRVSAEDFWYCVTRRVAIAVDKNSKRDSVRKMFVEHEGKKTLQVDVPSNNIYDVDYSWFFNEMSKKITNNVKVPEYVDAVTADFSTTTAVQKIVSQITLMSSLQEFFKFEMMLLCGIPAVEMLGIEEDWARLLSKLKVLRTLLEPIENDLGLSKAWWKTVQNTFEKLLATYKGTPDYDWWSRIVTYRGFGSGPSGYTGWMTEFMEGTTDLLKFGDFSSGLVTVPLTIAHPSGVEDTAALVAGALGFTVCEDSIDGVPSVKPFQGWSLLLRKDSPFRH